MTKKNVELTENPIPGMSLNIDDQVWIKRLFDRQDSAIEKYISDTYDKHASLICEQLAEIIQSQNDKLFDAITSIETKINEIEKRLGSIECRIDIMEEKGDRREVRLALLEQYSSFSYTLLRIGITLAIGLGLGWLIHYKFGG
jgi:hypothetical protein